ncbi:MAG: 5-deoxy-glucuronate isomerase [Candidatus Xenobia bacterium]
MRLAAAPGPVEVEVTPQQAGWRYLSFRVHLLDGVLEGITADEEALVVFLSGSGDIEAGGRRMRFDGRKNVFEGLPHFAYLPRRTPWRIRATTPLRLAWGEVPTDQDHPVRLCTPEDCRIEIRGDRNVQRQITHLVDPGCGCHRLLCVEVYTPSGNWSSYPPHKHDQDAPGHEVRLEEVYYYQVTHGGFALQRLYDDTRDEVVVARDGDLVLVQRGYHPVVAAPGYDVYYLNMLAGDEPSWLARDDAEHAWVRGVWDSRQPMHLPIDKKSFS